LCASLCASGPRFARGEIVGEGYVGCIVIRPDGSRFLARAVPDPLEQKPD
jgi:hypothetical protein